MEKNIFGENRRLLLIKNNLVTIIQERVPHDYNVLCIFNIKRR